MRVCVNQTRRACLCVLCPQVRMVAQEHLNRYSSSFDCARQLLAAEGPKGLFIGLGPTLW
jgi:hypothetical protein